MDSVLYIDTDALVLSDLKILWDKFQLFNDSQLLGVVPEAEHASLTSYNDEIGYPYYGKVGINAGVMLMNLTRMRTFGFTEKLYPIFKEYSKSLKWGDQCLLNILFHSYSGNMFARILMQLISLTES